MSEFDDKQTPLHNGSFPVNTPPASSVPTGQPTPVQPQSYAPAQPQQPYAPVNAQPAAPYAPQGFAGQPQQPTWQGQQP